MIISTKGRYALRVMMDLAVRGLEQPVRVKDISARQDISQKYLEQIISVLSKAGYVSSVRGPKGGYILAGKPEDYLVGDILRLAEGGLSCISIHETESGQNAEESVTMRLWNEIDAAITKVVDTYTLQDLVSWKMEDVYDYMI
ncbi:MAG: Rrf2 family transcriptional regulator [Lachnospiraceae bacterium]|nr:Rrf2 family transcriptional regulator [Lachnospiraceae bacterium]